MNAAMRVVERQQESGEATSEEVDIGLSLAAQLPSDVAEKQKTCAYLTEALVWIGSDGNSRAKRNAMALAVQMPADPARAAKVTNVISSIILAFFGGAAV